jgi:hypothetical protein
VRGQGPLTPYALTPHGFYGGEGGIRTPGTLIRGTHDFQSCTFNRSVTSPVSSMNNTDDYGKKVCARTVTQSLGSRHNRR